MNIETSTEAFKDLGFSDQETTVYLTLLKLGGSSAADLAKETGIKRTTTYPILDRLIENGAVETYEQGKKQFYAPIRPHKLIRSYEQKLKSLVDIVPLLEKLENNQKELFGIRFIQTKKELHSFYNGILDEYRGRSYSIIGSAPAFINIDPDFLLEFRRRRATHKIKTRLLLSHDSKSAIGQDDPSLLREFRYLPEKYDFKSTIDIYDDKIVIVGPNVKALAVIIAIPPMVDVFRSVFEILWDSRQNVT